LISISEDVIERIKTNTIETYNAKTFFSWYLYIKKNENRANKLGFPQTGGSDAHSHNSVGDMYNVVNVLPKTVKSVIDAIRRGRIRPEGKTSSLRERLRWSCG